MLPVSAARLAACALVLIVAAAPVPAAPERSRSEAAVEEARALVRLIRATEARYRELGPFRVRFEQSYASPTFGAEETDRGAILVDPPDRMLWSYDEPAGQRAVLDGSTWWLIEPDLEQILRRDRPAGVTDPLVDLLSGTLDLLAVFAARPSAEPPGDAAHVVVELVPRDPRDDIEVAVAEIDPATGDLRRLELIDPLGGRLVVRLGRPETARPPPDDLFRVSVPDGWSLIRD